MTGSLTARGCKRHDAKDPMQRSRRPRSKSPRQLDREIAEALRSPSRRGVAGYSNYGGSGPFAPMPSPAPRPKVRVDPRRGHATKKAATPTAVAKASKAGPSDKITIDQLAKLLGLPDWDRVDEMNQHNYWEMSRGAEDEDAQIEAEQKAQEEIYRQWYDAVESTAEKLLGEHGLELLAMKHTRKIQQNYRPHVQKIIPSKSWSDAANKIRETINGVGDLHFNDLSEFLKAEASTAKQAVLAHLGVIKRYPAVYGGLGANQMYEQAWR